MRIMDVTRRRMLAGTAAMAAAALAGTPVQGGMPWRGGVLRGRTMGTFYAVSLPSLPSSVGLTRCRAEIEAILAGVDRRMSTYRPETELSRFNARRGTSWIAVSPDTAAVVAESITVGRLTRGAFDVTAGPLVELWGFGPSQARSAPPPEAEIARVRQATGFEALSVRGASPALKKTKPGLGIDLSGVAKGFAVDRMAARLEDLGITDYLVEIGGEFRARGRNGRGRVWTLGVERPVPGRRRIQRVISVPTGGVATSGDYQAWFEAGGRRYSHIIDPRTASPIAHDLGSATVVARTAMRADALATAFMVLGFDAGRRLAEREAIAVLLIRRRDDGFEEWASPRFRPYIAEQRG